MWEFWKNRGEGGLPESHFHVFTVFNMGDADSFLASFSLCSLSLLYRSISFTHASLTVTQQMKNTHIFVKKNNQIAIFRYLWEVS